MSIVRASEKYADQILDLLVQVNNVHSDNRPDLFLRDMTKYTKDELLELLKDDLSPVFVSVDEDDNVLGYAFCVFQSHEKDNNWPNITTLYIDDICVGEKARGKKVATGLFEYVKQFAKDSGCYNITLNVWDKNEPAIAFYNKVGFHIQKYGMEVILDD